MANDRSSNDISVESKVALITGITGQVSKLNFKKMEIHLLITSKWNSLNVLFVRPRVLMEIKL